MSFVDFCGCGVNVRSAIERKVNGVGAGMSGRISPARGIPRHIFAQVHPNSMKGAHFHIEIRPTLKPNKGIRWWEAGCFGLKIMPQDCVSQHTNCKSLGFVIGLQLNLQEEKFQMK